MVQPLTARTDVLNFLSHRRSRPAKTLQGPAPDRNALTAILEIALRTPDHGKLEPWRIIIMNQASCAAFAQQSKARARELDLDEAVITKSTAALETAHLVVAVIASPKDSSKIPQLEQTLSAGALCQNILTTTLASGWGANWLSGWQAYDKPLLQQALGLSAKEWVAGFIHIGTETSQPPERPRPQLSSIVSWPDP